MNRLGQCLILYCRRIRPGSESERERMWAGCYGRLEASRKRFPEKFFKQDATTSTCAESCNKIYDFIYHWQNI